MESSSSGKTWRKPWELFPGKWDAESLEQPFGSRTVGFGLQRETRLQRCQARDAGHTQSSSVHRGFVGLRRASRREIQYSCTLKTAVFTPTDIRNHANGQPRTSRSFHPSGDSTRV